MHYAIRACICIRCYYCSENMTYLERFFVYLCAVFMKVTLTKEQVQWKAERKQMCRIYPCIVMVNITFLCKSHLLCVPMELECEFLQIVLLLA